MTLLSVAQQRELRLPRPWSRLSTCVQVATRAHRPLRGGVQQFGNSRGRGAGDAAPD